MPHGVLDLATLVIVDKVGRLLERHVISQSLTEWMSEHVPAYEQRVCPPYSALLNGNPWPYIEHGKPLSENDSILLTIEPGEPTTIFTVIALVAAGYSYYVASNIPNNYQESTPAGQSIYAPNGKANRVKPNAVIREVAGSVPIYPDLICPLRRKYDNNIEYLYLNLCVAVGEYEGDVSNLYIAETPISNYAGDVSAQFSPPGTDISGHDAFENWFTTSEVSDLKLITVADSEAGAWTIDASGDQMTSYDNGALVTFPFAIGDRFTITIGSNAGTYRVDSLSGTSNETATLVRQVVTRYWDGDGDDPRYSQGSYVTEYEDADSTTLTTVTGAAVDWGAVSGGVNWEGPFEVLPQGETTDVIEVDIRFPRGLTRTENDGSLSNSTVAVKIAYREVGTSTWTELDYSYTNNTLDELGFTEVISLPSSMRPEVRVRRVTADAATTSVINDVHCVRIRGKLDSPTSYPGVTTVQLRLRGTNALAQTAENQINLRGLVRKLPSLTSLKNHIENNDPLSLTADHGNSNLMPFLAWVTYDSSGENLLKWDDVEAIDSILKSRGDNLDIEFSDETTVWEAIKVIAAAGMAEMTVKEGLLSPVRTQIKTSSNINYFYPPDVMLGDGIRRTDQHYQASEPKGVVVEYLDAITGNNETVNCFIAGDNDAQAKRIQALGITDKTRAWRYGMRERRRLAFKPATYAFTTELDALNSDYGSFDAIASPLNANQSFYVTGYNAPNVNLDANVNVDAGESYYAVLRKPTGEYSGIYEINATSGASSIELLAPSTLDFTPVTDGSMESTICVIGTQDELIQKVWIRGISPAGDNTVSVTAEEYLEDIFSDDNNTPS
jgi:hypothetical protein